MARQTSDYRATVAAVREETRERLVALRLEREAAWAARRRRAESAAPAPETSVDATAAPPADEAMEPEALSEPQAPPADTAPADAMEIDTSPDPASADMAETVATEAAAGFEASDASPPEAESRPLPRHTLAKLRISAAISTATAGLMLHPPTEMTFTVEPEPEAQTAPDPAEPEPSDHESEATEASAEPVGPPPDERLIADLGVFGAGLQSRLSTLGLLTIDDLQKADIDAIETGLGTIARVIDVDALIRHVAGSRAST